MSNNIFAAGLGIVTTDSKGEVIQSFVQTKKNMVAVSDFVRICIEIFDYYGGCKTYSIADMNIDHLIDIFSCHQGTFLDSIRDAQYVTIYQNLDDIFANSNWVWTNQGPIHGDDFSFRQLSAEISGKKLEVFSVGSLIGDIGDIVEVNEELNNSYLSWGYEDPDTN